MAKRKKPKPFSAVEAVKTMAREHIGSPRASRVVIDKKSKEKKAKGRKVTIREMTDET